MLLRITFAAPPPPKSPLISSYPVLDASFQSPIVGPCTHTHLAYNVISAYLIVWWPGAELGGCQGGQCPPQILPGPPVAPQHFSGLFLKVLHRPLTTPLVAKLAPPVAPPNENVWLRPCWWLLSCDFFMWCSIAQSFHNKFFRLNIRF